MTSDSFRFITPIPTADAAPRWAGQFPQFDLIFGYSDLGHVFLTDAAGERAILHPFQAAAKSYGTFADATAFADAVLRDPGFAEHVVRPDHVAEVRALLGPLGDDQVYIPEPYPFLGGSLAPATYTVGDIWVFLDLVAQFQGIGADDDGPAYLRQFDDEQYASALDSWQWIGLDGRTPLYASLFGDIVLHGEDGLWFLDVVDGTLTQLCATPEELQTVLNDPAVGVPLLRVELTHELHASGLIPTADQVYDFGHPPVLGGARAADNVGLLDFAVAVGTAGQIHDQARLIPEGAQVRVAATEPRPRSGLRKWFGRK